MADPTIISRTLPPRRFLTDLAIWFRNKVIQTFLQIQHEIFCKNKYRPEDKFVPNWIPPDKSLVELSGLWREGKIEDVPSRFGDLSWIFIYFSFTWKDCSCLPCWRSCHTAGWETWWELSWLWQIPHNKDDKRYEGIDKSEMIKDLGTLEQQEEWLAWGPSCRPWGSWGCRSRSQRHLKEKVEKNSRSQWHIKEKKKKNSRSQWHIKEKKKKNSRSHWHIKEKKKKLVEVNGT